MEASERPQLPFDEGPGDGSVRAIDGRLVIERLEIDDARAAKLVRERVDAGHAPAQTVRDAVEIGARVLEREGTAAEVDYVRAEFERHLFNDAPVWRNEPHEQIGEVEHVLMDELDEEIEAIVVRRGEILGGEFSVPIDNVTEIFGGIVRVDISDEALAKLQPYEAR